MIVKGKLYVTLLCNLTLILLKHFHQEVDMGITGDNFYLNQPSNLANRKFI